MVEKRGKNRKRYTCIHTFYHFKSKFEKISDIIMFYVFIVIGLIFNRWNWSFLSSSNRFYPVSLKNLWERYLQIYEYILEVLQKYSFIVGNFLKR